MYAGNWANPKLFPFYFLLRQNCDFLRWSFDPSDIRSIWSFLFPYLCYLSSTNYFLPFFSMSESLLIYYISWEVRFSQIILAKLLLSIKICQRQGSRIKSKLMTSSYPTLFILEWWIFGIMRWIWRADESFLLPTFLGSCISLLCTQRGGCCPS